MGSEHLQPVFPVFVQNPWDSKSNHPVELFNPHQNEEQKKAPEKCCLGDDLLSFYSPMAFCACCEPSPKSSPKKSQKKGVGLLFSTMMKLEHSFDGRNPANQLRLVGVFPIIYMVFSTIPGGDSRISSINSIFRMFCVKVATPMPGWYLATLTAIFLKTCPSLMGGGHHPKTGHTLNMLKWFRVLLCVPPKPHPQQHLKKRLITFDYSHFKLTPLNYWISHPYQKGYDSLQGNVWPPQCHLSQRKQGLIGKFLRDDDGLHNPLLGGSPTFINGWLKGVTTSHLLPPATCNQTNPTLGTY